MAALTGFPGGVWALAYNLLNPTERQADRMQFDLMRRML